jgi:hypothetical protein
VVEKRYHIQPNALQCCGLMTTAAPPAWNIFTQIFAEHWDGLKYVHPRYNKPYYDSLVGKMLGCGEPEKLGSIAYRC